MGTPVVVEFYDIREIPVECIPYMVKIMWTITPIYGSFLNYYKA